jgi:hypothetical protein
MYCPRCGQEQNSGEISFCTKCGLDLSDVRKLLAPELTEKKTKRKQEINKAKRQGFSMILFGMVVIMILAILRDFFSVPKSLFAASVLIFMVGGMIRMVSPYIFGGNNLTESEKDLFEDNLKTAELSGEQFSGKILTKAEYHSPANFGTKKFDTNELAVPLSITEDSTRKLKKEFQTE